MSDDAFSREDQLILRELDHIQAIVARYDQFFFLNKQLCIGAFGFVIAASLKDELELAHYLPYVPIAFYAVELLFRWRFLSSYLLRIRELKYRLRGQYAEQYPKNEFKLYNVTASVKDYKRRRKYTFKVFDGVFYGVLFLFSLGFLVCH